VALVDEADCLGNKRQRLVRSTYQSFYAIDPPLHHVALRPHTNRLLKAAAEVVLTETCHSAEIGQGQSIIEMRLDVVAHSLQPLA
jgi:hypothetical protein